MEGSEKDKTPSFMVLPCTCGRQRCGSIVLAMTNPVIKPLEEDPETLACLVYFPVGAAQGLVNEIRKQARAQGVLLA